MTLRLSPLLRALVALLAAAAPALAVSMVAMPVAASAGGQTREVPRAATTTFTPTPAAAAAELPGTSGQEGRPVGPPALSRLVDPAQPAAPTAGAGQGTGVAGRRPALVSSFDGIDHRQQLLASDGNQFSLEPPDQGLCVGNGFVMESINDALTVYDQSGGSLKGVTALNAFYGYTPSIDRSTGIFGPFITDPSCLFDQATGRWFQLVVTTDTVPADDSPTGVIHLDLAVSNGPSPLGSWSIYRIDVTDDGTDGTPDHHCSTGPGAPPAHPNACFGDFPHIGADRNGIYLTTNEFSLFGPEFHSANIYAISKRALTSGAATLDVTQFETVGAVQFDGQSEPGFTVWPAVATDREFADAANGTEYFLSSDASHFVSATGTSDRLITWSITNTRSLESTPDLRLTEHVGLVAPYALPPHPEQRAGDFPLGQCLNDTTMPTPSGPGCWRNVISPEPGHDEVEAPLDSSDTRVMQVTYAGGLLWSALDTALTVRGHVEAAIEWFAIRPQTDGSRLDARVAGSGYLALPGDSVTYPAIGMTSAGRGVMAFTVVGRDYFPSAGAAAIDLHGTGPVQIVAAGLGPEDGLDGYMAFGTPIDPRWGDFGAAVAFGDQVWTGSEYIGQTCDLATYADPAHFGSCGGTRSTYANWYTRISHFQV